MMDVLANGMLTPSGADPWRLVPDLRTAGLAARVIIPAATRAAATSIAQQLSAAGHGGTTTHPIYFDLLDGSGLVRWDGQQWTVVGGPSVGRGPYAMAAGSLTATTGWTTVQLPAARFSQPPVVIGTPTDVVQGAVVVRYVTANSFGIACQHQGGPVSWVAVQMTAASGEG